MENRWGNNGNSEGLCLLGLHIWMWDLDYKESWVLKNWFFWTVLFEKTLESPLDCKEIKPVHPKGDQSGYLLEGLMLKLKLQYFGHLMQRTDSLEKTLMLGKIEGGRRRGQQRMRRLDGIIDSMDISKLWELMMDREAFRAAVHGVLKSRTQLSDWSELNWFLVPRAQLSWVCRNHDTYPSSSKHMDFMDLPVTEFISTLTGC